MAWYWWVLIGVGAVSLFVLLWKGRPWWARSTPSGSVSPGAAPSLTSEKAEEKREDAREKAEKERDAVRSDADKMRERL